MNWIFPEPRIKKFQAEWFFGKHRRPCYFHRPLHLQRLCHFTNLSWQKWKESTRDKTIRTDINIGQETLTYAVKGVTRASRWSLVSKITRQTHAQKYFRKTTISLVLYDLNFWWRRVPVGSPVPILTKPAITENANAEEVHWILNARYLEKLRWILVLSVC